MNNWRLAPRGRLPTPSRGETTTQPRTDDLLGRSEKPPGRLDQTIRHLTGDRRATERPGHVHHHDLCSRHQTRGASAPIYTCSFRRPRPASGAGPRPRRSARRGAGVPRTDRRRRAPVAPVLLAPARHRRTRRPRSAPSRRLTSARYPGVAHAVLRCTVRVLDKPETYDRNGMLLTQPRSRRQRIGHKSRKFTVVQPDPVGDRLEAWPETTQTAACVGSSAAWLSGRELPATGRDSCGSARRGWPYRLLRRGPLAKRRPARRRPSPAR